MSPVQNNKTVRPASACKPMDAKARAARKKRLALVKTIISVLTRTVCFFLFPAVWSTAFAGIKYIASQFGGRQPLVWNAFLYTLLGVVILTILLGRFFCGYGCSFGTYGDALYWLVSKIRLFFRKKVLKKKKKQLPTLPKAAGNAFRYGKYAVLAAVLYLAFTGQTGMITGSSPWLVFSALQKFQLPSAGGIAVLFFALVSAGMAVEPRFFCRFLCPLGAVFSILPLVPFSTVRRDREACLKGCSLCERTCPAHIELPDRNSEEVRHLMGECYQCAKCVYTCPKGNCSAATLPGEIRGLVWQAVRSGILIVLCWYLTYKIV